MKIFISWSGPREKVVAEALRDTLPILCTAEVDVFVSSKSIAKGAAGIEVINAELASAEYGIVLVSRSNQTEPWLNYEGGWLASLDRPVSTVLLDLRISDITTPLAPRQATNFADEADMAELLWQVAKTANPGLRDEAFAAVLASVWPKIRDSWDPSPEDTDDTPLRSDSDMLSELVERVRRIEETGDATHSMSADVLHRALLADERARMARTPSGAADPADPAVRSAARNGRFERAVRRAVELESHGAVTVLNARLERNSGNVTLLANRYTDPDEVRRLQSLVQDMVSADIRMQVDVIIADSAITQDIDGTDDTTPEGN